MKVSLAWLRELVDATFDADELAKRMTLAGFEIEGRGKFAAISGVVVARVVDKRPHPDAAKLTLVDVDDGSGRATQVVCGAPNVPAAGGLVVWARPGATLPNGVVLGEKPVRGIVSPGMLCAEDELGLGTSHAGIILLASDDGLAPGDDFAHELGLPDEVWEVNVTPNRPDALGHLGIAREVAALVGGKLKRPSAPELPSSGAPAKVELVDVEGCPRFCAVVVEGVTVRPSPLAVRLRLQALGVRAISNVVDATNLTMLLWGQPVHAYDLDKLAGGGVIVRRAKPDEKLKTLDDQTRTLTVDDVAICDANGAVGIGGVMGGASSEVSAGTTRLLLECAHFAPARVRRTAKRLGLHSEASHRFERGVDPNGCAEVERHLASTVLALAGGKVASALSDVYPRAIAPVTLELRPARTEALLGTRLTRDRQTALLSSIGLDAVDEGAGHIRVTVPTFRPDLSREVDLIEEIARLHGYDRIAPTLPQMREPPGPMRDLDDARNDAARDALRGLGLDEIVTYGFVGPSSLRAFGGDESRWVRVTNPLREEQSVMRTTLVAGLCQALQRNLARGHEDVRIYEVGGVFALAPGGKQPSPNPAIERWHVAGLLHGRADGWLKPGGGFDFFDAKGAVEQLLEALGHTADYQPSSLAWLHPRIQAEVRVGDAVIGHVGELHPSAARTLAVEATPLVFELDLQALPPPAPVMAAELPRFPSVVRDLSFFVDEEVTSRHLRALFERLRSPLCVDVRVLEEYRGEKRPAGRKGMLWSFTYRAPDRTLTDAEVQKLHDELVAKLGRELPVTLR
ncbi:MAG: phenylalanyl-tRNA synthetase, beta subunit [bacterium]|nr:phenylalanyl-tRNA synthetase, beta subunit [bacterium]